MPSDDVLARAERPAEHRPHPARRRKWPSPAIGSFTGSPTPVRSAVPPFSAAIAVNEVFNRAQSRKSAGETELFITPSAARFSQTMTSDSGRAAGATAPR